MPERSTNHHRNDTLKRDELYSSSPSPQRARSNLLRTENPLEAYISSGSHHYSATDRSVDSARVSEEKYSYSSGRKPAAKRTEEFERMTSRTPHSSSYNPTMQNASLGAAQKSQFPDKTTASSRRAPPQDAPMETSSQRRSNTPGQGVTGVPAPAMNLEGDGEMHDPIQSPPFVLLSSTQTRATEHDATAKAAAPSKMHQHKGTSGEKPRYSMPKKSLLSNENKQSSVMRETVLLQEARIESLERENHALRAQVKRLIEMLEDTGKKDAGCTVPEYERDIPNEEYFKSERRKENHGLRGSYRDAPHRYSSSPHSPGTRFVAELCEMMELDPGHHALLSTIMDNHYNGITRLESDYPDIQW